MTLPIVPLSRLWKWSIVLLAARACPSHARNDVASVATPSLRKHERSGFVGHGDTRHHFITFIIPSKGRATIDRTISSLADQSLGSWSAIVLLDGVLHQNSVENVDLRDEKWRSLSAILRWQNRLGPSLRVVSLPSRAGMNENSAGPVRNLGLSLAETPWVAFVDDDDTLHPKYVETVHMHAHALPDIDVVIFRMSFWDTVTNKRNPMPMIFPRLNATNFVINEVGISFAMRASLCKQATVDPRENYCFIPSSCEDFVLLNWLRSSHKNMLILPHIFYFVNDYRVDCTLFDCKGTTVWIKNNAPKVVAPT